MPVIRITGKHDELVYEGEGELILERDAFGDDSHPRTLVRQERTRLTRLRGPEVMTRQLDITEFLRTVPEDYTIIRRVEGRPCPMLSFDPMADPLRIPMPEVHTVWHLQVDCPADSLSWLRGILEAPVETPEESRARRAAEHEEYRSRMRAMRPGLLSLSEALENLCGRVGLHLGPGLDLQNVIGRAAEAEAESLRQQALGADITFDDIRESLQESYADRVRRRHTLSLISPEAVCEAFDLPPDLVLGPRPDYDDLIDSTRSEFPHDPLDYGRIYPGDMGTSHWTPPDDPDEKIRSCP